MGGEDRAAEIFFLSEGDGGDIFEGFDPGRDLSFEGFPRHFLHLLDAYFIVPELRNGGMEDLTTGEEEDLAALGFVPGINHGGCESPQKVDGQRRVRRREVVERGAWTSLRVVDRDGR